MPTIKNVLSQSLAVFALILPPAVHAAALNDTGQIQCFDETVTSTGTVSSGTPAPESAGFVGQDCSRGAAAADAVGVQLKIGTSSVEGRDYTKIGNDGSELADSAVRGAGATDWGCTRDNVTGLIWELRPDDNSFRDQDHRFSFGSATNSEGDTCAGTLSPCTTDQYVPAVNAAVVCGFSDWRLPTPLELESLVSYADPGATRNLIDRSLFPDQAYPSGQFLFWSDRPLVEDSTSAWAMDFDFGWTSLTGKTVAAFARLVRGAGTAGSRFTVVEAVSGEFVTRDSLTGLEWKTCAQGLSGSDCASGTRSNLSWSAALSAAAAESYAGHSDWRLPNTIELSSLRDFAVNNPAISGSTFPAVGNEIYWSATNDPRPTGLESAITYSFADFTAHAAQFKNQQIAVRLVRSGDFLAAHAANLDTVPDAFSFASVTAATSTLVESATITVAGLSGPASLKVSGAAQSAYSINGGAYASLAGAVRNGDILKLRHLSASSASGSAITTLNIGGVAATFTSTAVGAPDAPTAVSASAGDATATISFTAPTQTGGAAITGFTATSSPGSLTGSCSASPCTVNGLSNGTSYTFTVTASNGAESSPASAASNAVTPQAPQAIVFGSAPSVVVNGTGTLNASGGGSGNPVVFSSLSASICTVSGTNGSTVTGVAEGSCSIAANQGGSAAFTAAPQVSLNFNIIKSAQTISFGSAPDLRFAGTANLSATGGDSGNPVSFSSLTPATCSVSGSNGSTVAGVAVGSCTIAANQAGSAAYHAADQATLDFAVNKATQVISFGAAPSLQLGGSGSLTANGGGSGNPIAFSSLTPAVCSVSGSTVSAVAAGSCTVAADQTGNANYEAAQQQTQTIEVSKLAQAIGFLALSDRLITETPLQVSATGGPSGNPVAFSTTTPGICSSGGSNGSSIGLLAVGICSVRASQAGNDNYLAATPVDRSFEVYDGRPTLRFEGTPRATFKEGHNSRFPTHIAGDHAVVGHDPRGPASQKLQFSATTDNPTLLRIASFEESSSTPGNQPNTHYFAVVSEAGQTGTATITYTVTDGSGLSASVSVLVTVESANWPPTAEYSPTVINLQSAELGPRSVANFVRSSSPGPANESAQQVTHVIDPPYTEGPGPSVDGLSIDSAGTLHYTVRSGSGPVPGPSSYTAFGVQPVDNGPGPASRCRIYYDALDGLPVYGGDNPCGIGRTITINFGQVASTGIVVVRNFLSGAGSGASKAITPVGYQITVENNGNQPLTGVRVEGPLPASLSGASWTCSVPVGACNPASGSGAINTLVDLAVGASAQLTLNAQLVQEASFVVLPLGATLPDDAPGEVKVNTQRQFIDAVSNGAIHLGGFEN